MNELVISVKVKPNAKNSLFEALPDGSYKAELKSAPVDGKANKELIALVAKHFKVAKSAVDIKNGASGKMKRLVISQS